MEFKDLFESGGTLTLRKGTTNPITANFFTSLGMHLHGKTTNPAIRKSFLAANREKAKATGSDTASHIGASEIASSKSQHTFDANKLNDKVQKNPVIKPPKPFVPNHTTTPHPSFTPVHLAQHQPHIVQPRHTTPHASTSPFFQQHVNKIKRPF